jgi:hypothetical protein
MYFNSARNQALAATLSSPGQDGSSAFSFHARTKSELAFPGAL